MLTYQLKEVGENAWFVDVYRDDDEPLCFCSRLELTRCGPELYSQLYGGNLSPEEQEELTVVLAIALDEIKDRGLAPH